MYAGSNVPRSASRRALDLLEERLVAEEADALLDRHVLAVQPDADDGAAQADERFGELPEPDRRVRLAEALVDHHLLAVVRPAFDECGRREQDRLAQLAVDLPQVLVVEEVAGKHLVDGDRPERAVVEVAQVLGLALGGPRRIHVGDVVERALRRASRTAPGSTCSRTSSGRTAASADRDRSALGDADDPLAGDEVLQLRELLLRRPARAARPAGCSCLARCQAASGRRRSGVTATRRNSSCVALQLARRDREEPVGAERDALVELELLLELLAAEPERALAPRREVLLEVVD